MRPTDALRVLGDQYSITIIAATQKQEKTAIELSQRFGIPIAVAYRRVQELVQAGLLEAAGQALTKEAKRIWMYRAKISKAQADFDGSALRVAFFALDGTKNDFGGPWSVQERAGPATAWEAERVRKGTSLYFPAAKPAGAPAATPRLPARAAGEGSAPSGGSAG